MSGIHDIEYYEAQVRDLVREIGATVIDLRTNDPAAYVSSTISRADKLGRQAAWLLQNATALYALRERDRRGR